MTREGGGGSDAGRCGGREQAALWTSAAAASRPRPSAHPRQSRGAGASPAPAAAPAAAPPGWHACAGTMPPTLGSGWRRPVGAWGGVRGEGWSGAARRGRAACRAGAPQPQRAPQTACISKPQPHQGREKGQVVKVVAQDRCGRGPRRILCRLEQPQAGQHRGLGGWREERRRRGREMVGQRGPHQHEACTMKQAVAGCAPPQHP